jgi:hypothetical protein
MKQALRNLCITAAGVTLLAACGGSSDDSGGLTCGTPTAEPATIAAQNAPMIAGAVAEVVMGRGVFSLIFTPDTPIAASGKDAAVSPILSAAMKSAAPSQLYATSSGLEDCAISGTVDVQVIMDNPLEPSINDSFIFEFTYCDDGAGVVVDGGMTITIVDRVGDPATDSFLLGMPINFSAFAITEGNETTSADGTISIEVNSLNPPVTTITIATSTFVTTSEGSEEFLTNFSVTITEDASMFPVAVTVETSFTFSSPRIGGEVTVTTSLALESMGENYPLFGEPRIEGANQAVIVMIALDANTVRLEVDIDGDGAVDETLDMTWDELMAAA